MEHFTNSQVAAIGYELDGFLVLVGGRLTEVQAIEGIPREHLLLVDGNASVELCATATAAQILRDLLSQGHEMAVVSGRVVHRGGYSVLSVDNAWALKFLEMKGPAWFIEELMRQRRTEAIAAGDDVSAADDVDF